MKSDISRDPSRDDGNRVTVTYDRSPDERADLSVIRGVACALNIDPLRLSPLSEAVDPDALARLMDGGHRTDGERFELSFRYGSCDVTLYADDRVVIEPVAERDATDSLVGSRQ